MSLIDLSLSTTHTGGSSSGGKRGSGRGGTMVVVVVLLLGVGMDIHRAGLDSQGDLQEVLVVCRYKCTHADRWRESRGRRETRIRTTLGESGRGTTTTRCRDSGSGGGGSGMLVDGEGKCLFFLGGNL